MKPNKSKLFFATLVALFLSLDSCDKFKPEFKELFLHNLWQFESYTVTVNGKEYNYIDSVPKEFELFQPVIENGKNILTLPYMLNFSGIDSTDWSISDNGDSLTLVYGDLLYNEHSGEYKMYISHEKILDYDKSSFESRETKGDTVIYRTYKIYSKD